MKKILEVLKKNYLIPTLLLNIIIFIIGIFAVGFLKTFLLITIIFIIPTIIQYRGLIMKKLKKNKTKKRIEIPKKKKIKKNKVLHFILVFILGFLIICIIAGIIFTISIIKDAPDFNPENLYRKESSILLDKDGEIITKLGLERREKIEYSQIPEVLIDAIIATEDSRYFSHNGFDLPRFLRASLGQLRGQDAGGASTISMQVVKNNFTSVKQTIKRKFTDIYLSVFLLEKNYSKEEILEFYVNAPYLGAGSYGIAEASRTYFNKEVNEINLSEAALIAGIFQAPGAYDPFINPELAEQRRNTVLYLMRRHNYISEEQEKLAKSIPIESLIVDRRSNVNNYQSFIDTVVVEVETKTELSPYTTPMIIHTTMDRKKQDEINALMKGETFTWVNDVVQAGIAITNINTGEIVALGGGRNLVGERVFNFATMLKKQIGSTAKPLFDYGPGVEYNNWSTYTPFIDEPHSYSSGNSIKNWDYKYLGFLTLRQSLAYSRNIPALKAFQSVDNKNIHDFTLGLGLNPEISDGYVHEAHALGGYNGSNPLELAAAYGSFGNGGFYIKPYSFTKIEYIETKETEEFKEPKIKAMSDSTAYIITNSLIYTVTNGLSGSLRRSGYEIAAKTGTSNFDSKVIRANKLPSGAINDLWTIGFTPTYSIGLWYGYDKINRDFVSTSADSPRKERLFGSVLNIVLKDSDKKFKRPSSVINVSIEKGTIPGMLPSEFTPSNMITTEVYKRGTEPFQESLRYQKLPNPTNLEVENKNTTLKISWNSIATPEYFTDEYINEFFNTNYNVPEPAILQHKQKIAEEFGTISYEVYYKDSSNNLLKIGETSNDYINMNKPLESTTMTFVVKTSWSNFKNNKSNGIELEYYNEAADISLVGSEIITLSLDSTFVDSNPPYTIMLDKIDITSSSTLKSKTIRKKSDNSIVSTIDTSVIETYYIDYVILYNSTEFTLRRTVEIK